MAVTRIELNGKLNKPRRLGATPSGRAVLRLSLDCGEDGEPLPLEVVVMDQEAAELARALSAGQRVWAAGSLRAVRRGTLASEGYRIEVMASEVRPEQPGRQSGGKLI